MSAAEDLQAQIAKDLTDRNFFGWLLANGSSPLWETRTPEQEIARMATAVAAPELERRLQAERNRITAEIEAEREKTRDTEGATLRDENVLNGIVNGLGIALKIVRGES